MNTELDNMACAPPEKTGEKRGVSSLSSDNDASDDSSYSLVDNSSFHEGPSESVQDTSLETRDETTASTSSSSTRKGRRKVNKQRYLEGMSRKPYRVSRELQLSFEDSDSTHDRSSSSSNSMGCHIEQSQWNKNVCKSCAPVLQKYAVTFTSLKRQGSELKKRKRINPHPKKPETLQYRDLVRQNEWLRCNIFGYSWKLSFLL